MTTRRHISFPCGADRLAGTLDGSTTAQSRETGLLLVSGGNEIRSGAWAGQAQLAARIAAEGYPVLRFDRRGCGDSEGFNGGFQTSGPDIIAALTAFRREQPQLGRVIGMGNCDAASALMLASGAGCDGLILSNPWTFDNNSPEDSPPATVRSHYRNRLKDLGAIKRLFTGKVAIAPLLSSLVSAAKPVSASGSLTQELATGLARFKGRVRFLVAARDRTGQAFMARWDDDDGRIHVCPNATHSFVEPHAREWLIANTLEELRRLS
ncbi:hydrolase 1, exosortase A system-associated [Novosphingobium sp. M1R2S20]|uniref:Hydrolase 1, exosortase A system-associated n=1 Tax=Novosphingobium rhizovicinum TaxID=3228928 RepID=A0ABV3RH02_9SPHN